MTLREKWQAKQLRLGVWLLRRSGYQFHAFAIKPELLAAARVAIAEVERVAGVEPDSSQRKRQQALLMLKNAIPELPEHDAMNALQVALDVMKRS